MQFKHLSIVAAFPERKHVVKGRGDAATQAALAGSNIPFSLGFAHQLQLAALDDLTLGLIFNRKHYGLDLSSISVGN